MKTIENLNDEIKTLNSVKEDRERRNKELEEKNDEYQVKIEKANNDFEYKKLLELFNKNEARIDKNETKINWIKAEIKEKEDKIDRINEDNKPNKKPKLEEKTSEIVKLNVGGTHFMTTKATLVQCDFFHALFSGNYNINYDLEGFIFLDRDATVFQVILNYLRTRVLESKHLNYNQVEAEALFFGIKELISKKKSATNSGNKSSDFSELMFKQNRSNLLESFNQQQKQWFLNYENFKTGDINLSGSMSSEELNR